MNRSILFQFLKGLKIGILGFAGRYLARKNGDKGRGSGRKKNFGSGRVEKNILCFLGATGETEHF